MGSGMSYPGTYVGQRVRVIRNMYYSDQYVGKLGTITSRHDGLSGYGTVEVELDGEHYSPPTPGWCQHTHMSVDQLEPAEVLVGAC